jgi:cysteine desulfurase
MKQAIYLDYNATTPVEPAVLEAMLPWLREQFGNPSSTHAYGQRAAQAVAVARRQVADLIGAHAQEIVFTGCATEANHLALLGVARSFGAGKRHLVVSAIEHPAVMAPALQLRQQGWDVTVLPVDACGQVSPAQLVDVLRPETAMVSIMHANNEVGTLQPIQAISRITRPRGILLHTDAAQSAGKVSLRVDDLGVDLLTLAGHKFYAPKGVGALYVRQGTPIQSLMQGGGQEHGMRAGTENVPAIVGLGAAAALALQTLPGTSSQLREFRDQLHALLADGIPGRQLNGHPEQRLPNTLHVSIPGISGSRLLQEVVHSVAASVGSACHSEHDAVSGVLAAMGIGAARASGAVRLSVGRMTNSDEIAQAASSLVDAWQHLTRP